MQDSACCQTDLEFVYETIIPRDIGMCIMLRGKVRGFSLIHIPAFELNPECAKRLRDNGSLGRPGDLENSELAVPFRGLDKVTRHACILYLFQPAKRRRIVLAYTHRDMRYVAQNPTLNSTH